MAEKEERGRPNGVPHLSHSRISRYLLCPEQYRLYYIENLRPRFYSANLAFGQAVHQALAALFKTGADPADTFAALWNDARQFDLRYGARDSWEKLNETGKSLLGLFELAELPRIGKVAASEKVFELGITAIDEPFHRGHRLGGRVRREEDRDRFQDIGIHLRGARIGSRTNSPPTSSQSRRRSRWRYASS